MRRSVNILAGLMIVYVMPLVLFYGLSVRQLVAFRTTLAWWVPWTLWGGSFVLMGLFWLLATVEQRRRKQTGRQRVHDAREPDEMPGHGSPTP